MLDSGKPAKRISFATITIVAILFLSAISKILHGVRGYENLADFVKLLLLAALIYQLYRTWKLRSLRQAAADLRTETAALTPAIESHRQEVAKLKAINTQLQACHVALAEQKTVELQIEFNRILAEFKTQKAVCDAFEQHMQPGLQHLRQSTEKLKAQQAEVVRGLKTSA